MPGATPYLTRTITEVAPLIERRELSPLDLLDAQLARIEALDGQLKSFVRVTADLAREQAHAAEREIAAGRYRGPLHGIPIGLKDLIDTAGIPTTCASPMLRDHRPAHNAAIVDKLAAAGAVCVGKLNLTEFALYGYHPDLDYPRNPWHPDYWAGVSSSGSGVAVAAALCFGAIGSDTGGSIRFPAAACGIVGLKPSFGKVSRHGVFPLADTLDHLGPMTRCVADAALMLAVLEGRDERDPATRSDPAVDYLTAIAGGASGLRVGIDRAYCSADTDPAQTDATARACFMLRGQGVEIVDIDLSGITAAGEHWLAICSVDALLHHRAFYPARAAEYGPVFRALLEHGERVTAEDYARAQRVRQAVTALLERATVVIANDSGPMHIAAALGVPLVTLFGPTNPVRTGPYGRPLTVLRLDLQCSPCYSRECVHRSCLQWLTPDAVLDHVASQLRQQTAPPEHV